jgi:CSLREA domain-containing protein
MDPRRPLDTRRVLARAAKIALALALPTLLIPAGPVQAQIWRGIDVDPVDDDDPTAGCTLREAIHLANMGLGPGTHPNGCTVTEVPLGPDPGVLYIISLPAYTLTGAPDDDANASGDLDIAADVWIFGEGPGLTIVVGGSLDRVFHVDPAGTGDVGVCFAGLTITQGSVTGWGGGIFNNGSSVFLTEAALTGNQASGPASPGGAICNGNGTLIVEDSTVSGNTAGTSGGGLFNAADTAALSNVTIADNAADLDADGNGNAGSIYASGGTVTLKNTIVAVNADWTASPGAIHYDLSGLIQGNAPTSSATPRAARAARALAPTSSTPTPAQARSRTTAAAPGPTPSARTARPTTRSWTAPTWRADRSARTSAACPVPRGPPAISAPSSWCPLSTTCPPC